MVFGKDGGLAYVLGSPGGPRHHHVQSQGPDRADRLASSIPPQAAASGQSRQHRGHPADRSRCRMGRRSPPALPPRATGAPDRLDQRGAHHRDRRPTASKAAPIRAAKAWRWGIRRGPVDALSRSSRWPTENYRLRSEAPASSACGRRSPWREPVTRSRSTSARPSRSPTPAVPMPAPCSRRAARRKARRPSSGIWANAASRCGVRPIPAPSPTARWSWRSTATGPSSTASPA